MISWAVIYGEFRGLLGRRAHFWEQCQGRQRIPTPSHSWLATLPVPLLKAMLSAREKERDAHPAHVSLPDAFPR